MVVGHLPFMARLASYLILGQIEPPVIRFQNSGIVCLERLADVSGWQIIWALMPKVGGGS